LENPEPEDKDILNQRIEIRFDKGRDVSYTYSELYFLMINFPERTFNDTYLFTDGFAAAVFLPSDVPDPNDEYGGATGRKYRVLCKGDSSHMAMYLQVFWGELKRIQDNGGQVYLMLVNAPYPND
jgi:hypothetical protein